MDRDPHAHPARARRLDRGGERVADRPRDAHVVERQVERAMGLADPGRDPAADLLGALPALVERADRQLARARAHAPAPPGSASAASG